MIPCPYCGTPNRRGSKYCSNCGQRLEAVSAITCAACERLNPPGSTYCAFCGALLTTAQRATESIPGQYMQSLERTGTQELERVKLAPHPELPSWLYEQPTMPPEAASQPSSALQVATVQKSVEEQSKYLQDIQGVLPKTDVWLSSSMQRALGTLGLAADDARNKKSERRTGCAMLGLVALSCLIGLVLLASYSALSEGRE